MLNGQHQLIHNFNTMTQKTYERKKKELYDAYGIQAEIRNKAVKEIDKIIKKLHKLEREYWDYR